LYKELEGGASWNHEKRELRLFAGEAEEELKFQMAHELAHLVSFDLVKRLGYVDRKGYPSNVPIWFLEGLAECAAIKWAAEADRGYYLTNRALTNFKTDVENGNSPIGTLNKVITREARKVHGYEYAAVGTFVEFLHRECGGSKTLVSVWVDAAEDGKLKEAIERHTGESLNSLKVKWEFFLKDWYEFKIDGGGGEEKE
ncbi:MAG: hypothetical protein RDV41_06980, partial [Planctomycetota bacterium]|nr:hypothetical protein [Planctomycetota bacterium]